MSPELDVFFSGKYSDKFQFLVEALFSRDEQELERLQLGWTPKPGNTLWLGRMHNPLGLWNNRYHHGSYLQLTISRPHIFEYEDAGGPLPTHLLGLMWDGSHVSTNNPATSGWRYMAALGYGPKWEEGLEAAKPLEGADRVDHSPMATAAVFYKPDIYAESEIGAFVNRTEIPLSGQPTGNIELVIAGVSFHWVFDEVELMGAVVAVDDKVSDVATRRGRFFSGYLQAAYSWRTDLTLYARVGATTNWRQDPYLSRFPAFGHAERLAGLRYDVTARHALKLEFSQDRFLHRTLRHIAVQWSTYFP